jgi:hypothetical protein
MDMPKRPRETDEFEEADENTRQTKNGVWEGVIIKIFLD